MRIALIVMAGLAALAIVVLLTLSSASLQCDAQSSPGPRIADAILIEGCQ
jgi:hypothetical protein